MKFGDGYAERHACRGSLVAETNGLGVAGIGVAVGKVETARDAVHRPVWVQVAETKCLVDLAVVERKADALATTEEIVLGDVGVENDTGCLREAEAQHQVAGRPFLDREIDVDLISRSGDSRRFHADVLEVAEATQTHLGALDLGRGNPPSLELPQLAAHDFIAGLRVSEEIDAAHIDSLARIDEVSDVRDAVLLVDIWNGVDIGKGIAFVAEPVGDVLAGCRQSLA